MVPSSIVVLKHFSGSKVSSEKNMESAIERESLSLRRSLSLDDAASTISSIDEAEVLEIALKSRNLWLNKDVLF